jgi:hypothetical protein
MISWRDIWRIINSSRTSTYRAGNTIKVRDSSNFKALPLSKQDEINLMTENYQKAEFIRRNGTPDTYEQIKQRSANIIPLMINNYKTNKPVTAAVRDAIGNLPTMSGIQGQDPATINLVTPNLYITPHEAAAIYSQKGLPETIINKKGKSPILNGVRIKNPKLSPAQHDLIRDDMLKNGLTNKIAEGIIQSLLYGGGIMFPMFKKDSPVTTHLPIEILAKYGVIGKDCISHWVVLDRWNTVHIPNWNPTAKDFLYPNYYYVPFLGSHVSGKRCARIITAPQYGYWAVLMTLGWGISDIPGWIESVLNYYNVMSAIPTMIAQMSILVRTLNVDSYMATEGMDIMSNIDFENTIKIREASLHNPINMDVIGDLKALQRDFKEVPNLVRLVRQDVGGKANIPEEMLWSSERGAFSSGDPTEGAQEKQWESIKYIHRDAAAQLRYIAMLQVINALGTGNDVISALPYTTIEFDNPIISNAEIRAGIGKMLGEMAFDLVSAGIPSDVCMELMQSYGDEEFTVRSNIFEDLKKRQAITDKREEEKHELEMERLRAEIKNIRENPGGMGGGGISKGSGSSGYSRLEQKKKEKTRGTAARKQALEKAKGKKI